MNFTRRMLRFVVDAGLLVRVAVVLIGLPLVWIYGLHWQDRRERRLAAGLCPACGYPRAGNVSGICPECGNRLPFHPE